MCAILHTGIELYLGAEEGGGLGWNVLVDLPLFAHACAYVFMSECAYIYICLITNLPVSRVWIIRLESRRDEEVEGSARTIYYTYTQKDGNYTRKMFTCIISRHVHTQQLVR